MPHVVKGLVQAMLEAETGSKCKIANTLAPDRATIFPAGAAHSQKFVKGPCEFIAARGTSDAALTIC
jgi:hypothetical protein